MLCNQRDYLKILSYWSWEANVGDYLGGKTCLNDKIKDK